MFSAVGMEVIKLKRERIGFLDLSGLNSGEYRKITPKEVKILYSLINTKK
jgi:23S rRNA pseudouridine2605 synthase